MSVRLKLMGYADGRPSAHDGQYLVRADIETGGMLPLLTTTNDPERAIVFAGLVEATDYWKRVSATRPKRPDGKLNRPLTAYNIVIEQVAEGDTNV